MPARLHPIYFVASAFLLLAPLSVATGLSIAEPTKYARVGLTALMVVMWVVSGKKMRLGRACRSLVAFMIAFTLSAAWSDLPHWALFYKTMLLLTCLAGMALVGLIGTTAELKRGLRHLGIVAAVAGGCAFAIYWSDPQQNTSNDRMAVWGMNANTLGQAAAPLLLLVMYVALNDSSRFWQSCMYVGAGLLLLVIIGTGSRGALLMAGAGVLPLLLPKAKRPRTLFVAAIALGVAVYLAFYAFDMAGTDRLTEAITKDTRSGLWQFGFRRFLESPLIGEGWLHWGESWGSIQNIYLQTLIEAGLLGGLFMGYFLVVAVVTWRSVYKWLADRRLSTNLCFLSAALLGGVLVHGLAESSTLQGSSVGALLLGMGVALVDRTRELTSLDAQNVLGRRRTASGSRLRPPAVVCRKRTISQGPAVRFRERLVITPTRSTAGTVPE